MKIILPKDELYNFYVSKILSSTDVAKKYNCSKNTVLRNLKLHNIPVRKFTNYKRKLRKPLDKKLLFKLYVIEGKTSVYTAKLLQTTPDTVLRQLRKYGFGQLIRNSGSTGLETKISKSELFRRYVTNKEFATDIAKDFNCSSGTILNYLRKYGLGKHITKCGYKPWLCGKSSATKRPDVRKKLRENWADKTGRKNGMFGKPAAHGKKIIYKGIWLRSTWEVKYAKYLDRNKIKWLYEPKAFDLGEATYRPDFYLPKLNKYIEIKGFWRDRAKEKFNLFQKMYSNISIEILNELELTKLGVL